MGEFTMPIDPRMVKWDNEPTDAPEIDPRMVKWDDGQSNDNQSWFDKQSKGLATAPINAYLGLKQMFGGLDPIEQNILAQNKEAEKKAPIASIGSNLLTAVPSILAGGLSIPAAAGFGAINGMVQPVEGDQTLSNIASGKLTNSALGGVFGAAGQYGSNKIAGALANRFATKSAESAADASRNSVKDAVLAESRGAGYTVPQSQVQPTFFGNRLESIGGKAAVKQEATLRNQEVSNALARKAIGLPEDAPLSLGNIAKVREQSYAPYVEVSKLPVRPAQTGSTLTNTPAIPGFNPAAELEALKVARADAQAWYKAYNATPHPDTLTKAKETQALADSIEQSLQDYAKSQGRKDLIPELVKARKEIAKTYTVERALNSATGDINAPVLGRLAGKQKPLSDGLDTIGKFNQAFPQISRPGVATQSPGVSFAEPVSMGLAGLAGQAATGSPIGLMAAGLPLLRGPARSIALSKMAQGPRNYDIGALTRLTGKIPKDAFDVLGLGTAGYATPFIGGLLAAQ
jgi:hypothetical protein